MTNEELKNARIKAQELKYRYITINFIKDLFSGFTITNISGTPIDCGVDVRFTAVTSSGIETYDVEVKERNKTQYQLEHYPNSELKKSKKESMYSAHTNQHLIYIQYVNEIAYIYDMDKLNWNDVKLRMWKIKKTQYDDKSEYVDTPTYFIPYKQKLKAVDAHKYYDNYALYIQAKEKKQLQTQLF